MKISIARNRISINSLGKPIHETEEGIRNFWKWFGRSKTIDKYGRPLVLYHGTNNFWKKSFKDRPNTMIFFSDDEIVADSYVDEEFGMGNGGTIRAYVRLEKPRIVDFKWRAYDNADLDIAQEFGTRRGEPAIDVMALKLKRAGSHDGLIVKNVIDNHGGDGLGMPPSTVFVAFSPYQIKTTANRGAFGVEDRRLDY